jgi:SMC interacting uncharacterized protein involved in chromosome segregation
VVERQVKWSEEKTLSAFKSIIDEYGLSPNQLLYDQKNGRISLNPEFLKELNQLKDAITRFPGGLDGVYGACK